MEHNDGNKHRIVGSTFRISTSRSKRWRISHLDPIAKSADYWREVARVLHRMKRHHDALDCWKAGELMTLQNHDLSNIMIESWYHGMIETLFAVVVRTADD